MTSEKKRLFFAVNLPAEVKQFIAEELFPLLPEGSLKKVLPENLHVTLHFLGYFPEEGLKELQNKINSVELNCFEAELNCVGHFKGNVIWLGFGKGTDELILLNRKLQQALGTRDERFHAHVTIARNKSLKMEGIQKIVERAGKIMQPKKISVKSFELMESQLRKQGPKYETVFSQKLNQNA